MRVYARLTVPDCDCDRLQDGSDSDGAEPKPHSTRSLLARLVQVRMRTEVREQRDLQSATQRAYAVARKLDALEYRAVMLALSVTLLRAGVPRDVRRIIVRTAVKQSRFTHLLA